ncbi:MAG TPA: hypothetical protein VHV10_02830 [Ktedonobacteraceae bacterium]|jgi:hypothetical protein|nr:hypothetical protein [Ktedonobacteraceae bacterium]
MAIIVNNKETSIDEKAFYIDHDGQIYEATIKSIEERDGLHYADLEIDKGGKSLGVKGAVYNTSPEKHSWNHPRNPEETKWHNEPDFYGEIPAYEYEDEEDSETEEEEGE